MNMDKVILEKFKEVTIEVVDKQAIATNEVVNLVNKLPIQFNDSNEALAQNMLRVLIAGQGAILLGLSVLLHEDDTEIEIPQAFRDAFNDSGKE